MKILIIGGNGTIGKKVTERLSHKHEVIVAGRHSGDVTVDFSDSKSIKSMFEKVGKLDSIVTIAGDAKWDKFNKLSEDDFYIGIKSKLMGQVNVVRIGKDYFPGNTPVPMSKIVDGYIKCIEGIITGRIIRIMA